MADKSRSNIPAQRPLELVVQANSATRALNIVGDRWTLMILYLAFMRVRRFDDFQGRIGLARSLLTDRLKRLQDAGVLCKVQYRERPPWHEYRLTEMGRDLYSVILTIVGWEKRWFFDRSNPVHRLRHSCGREFTPEMRCGHCNHLVFARDLHVEDGPGAGYEPSPPPRAQRRSIVPAKRMNPGNPMLDRVLQVLGDRWTSHVIASAFLGRRRFHEFQEALGIATNILSDRLVRLVKLGIFRRSLYQRRPARWEYRLTEKGLDLQPLVIELFRWGDRWLATKKGPPQYIFHRTCGRRLQPQITCDQCAGPATLETVQAPG
jgi:DNA-binding HxlR family transcriptional regulator